MLYIYSWEYNKEEIEFVNYYFSIDKLFQNKIQNHTSHKHQIKRQNK